MARERVRKKSGRAPVGRARSLAIKAFWVALVQALFEHVDHEERRAFGFEPGEESDERPRHRGAVLDKCREASIDARFEGRVGHRAAPASPRRPRATRSRPKKAAPGKASARRSAKRVLPLPKGPMM